MTWRANNIAVIGCSGAIGRAFIEHLAVKYPEATIFGFSRQKLRKPFKHISYHVIDYSEETSIEACAVLASQQAPLDMVIVATGMLHEGDIQPEKSLKDLSAQKFMRLFQVNSVTPALIAKSFLPRLSKEHTSFFGVLSARVSSISDNSLGGWYSYRASKAALNMIVKNAAIEMGRRNKKAIIVALHPGTVDSELSMPFKANIPADRLFSAEYAVDKLMIVIETLTPAQSGKIFAWDGLEILP